MQLLTIKTKIKINLIIGVLISTNLFDVITFYRTFSKSKRNVISIKIISLRLFIHCVIHFSKENILREDEITFSFSFFFSLSVLVIYNKK